MEMMLTAGDCSFSFLTKSSILRSPSFNTRLVKVSDLSFLRRGTRTNKLLGDRLTVEAMLSSWRFYHKKETWIQVELEAVVEMWEQVKSKWVRVFFSSNKNDWIPKQPGRKDLNSFISSSFVFTGPCANWPSDSGAIPGSCNSSKRLQNLKSPMRMCSEATFRSERRINWWPIEEETVCQWRRSNR